MQLPIEACNVGSELGRLVHIDRQHTPRRSVARYRLGPSGFSDRRPQFAGTSIGAPRFELGTSSPRQPPEADCGWLQKDATDAISRAFN
jgi:hypothetical protein